MKNFPYLVREKYAKLNDGKCCYEMSDRTGFHFYRCSKKAKKYIDGIGFCGIHARSVERWRKQTGVDYG